MQPRNILGTVVGGAATLLLVAAVLFAIVLLVPGVVGAEGSYVVQSDSMSPAISAGDMVVTKAVDADDLETGTVITFRQAASTQNDRVTHRIVGVEERDGEPRYVTKGDANEEVDRELVAPSQIEGKVWFTIPVLGYLVSFAGTDLGLITLVVLPAVALVVSEVYSLYVAAEPEPDKSNGGTG